MISTGRGHHRRASRPPTTPKRDMSHYLYRNILTNRSGVYTDPADRRANLAAARAELD